MRILQRALGAILLLSLLIAPAALLAQGDEPVDVTGSQIVLDLLNTLVGASEIELDLNISPSGTTAGFEAFCRGDADIAGATRAISVEEEAACIENEVDFAEFLLGYDVIALISHPDLTFAQCLAPEDLTKIFAPSAENEVTNWEQTAIESAFSSPLTIYFPPDNTATYAQFDRLVDGFGLRMDVNIEDTETAIIEAVGSTPGAIGVVGFTAARDADDVQVVQLNNSELGECFGPSADTVEERQYPAADRLLLYVNRSVMERPSLREMLSSAISEDVSPVIADAGYSPPSEHIRTLNRTILEGDEGGRQFSLEVATFRIPENLFGQVNLGGAANLREYIESATQQFGSEYSGVTFNITLLGTPAGAEQLCNGESDILTTYRPLTDEEAAPCEENGIETVEIGLGNEAVILVANADSSYLECLTTEQLLTIWGSPPSETVNNWSEVDASFPNDAMFLFASPATVGRSYTDLLLTPEEGPILPIRLDTAENKADPLYRAAATANVEGGLTYMTWPEYQRVLENEQAGIQLVSVDGSAGCVQPSVETIGSGSYPLTRRGMLIINRVSLANPSVQSFLWYLVSDANYSLLEDAGLVGLSFGELPALRDRLQTLYSEAEAEAARAAEATPEATPETTPETTAEVTAEATAEATPETNGE